MAKQAVTVFLVLACLIMSPAAWASGVTITVAPEATVTGPDIALGDIAAVSGSDMERVKSLRQIYLGGAAPPGGRLILTRELLGMRLAASQSDFNGITWSVPDSIAVTTGGQLIGGQQLAQTAVELLKQKAGAHTGKDVRISLLQEPEDLVAPLGKISFDMAVSVIRYSLPQTAHLAVYRDGTLFTQIPIKYEMKIFEMVVTAAQNIGSRETLTKDNLRLMSVDTGRLPAGYLTDIHKAAGFVAKRPVGAGAVLYDSHVERPVLIKRGSIVTVVARAGGVRVTVPGLALQDGSEGQVILVRNISSKKVLSAQVIDGGSVHVPMYSGR